MKNLMVILILTFTYATNTFSQSEWSVVVGPTFSNITHSGDGGLIGSTNSFTGIKTGVGYDYLIAPHFKIQTGLFYNLSGFTAQQGFDFELYNINIPADVRAITRLHFIEIPILLSTHFGNEKYNIYMHAGPQMAYAVDGDLQLRARLLFDFNLGNYDINLKNENFRQFEIGGLVGAGINAKLNNKLAFNAGIDYMHGFTDLTKEPILNINTMRYGVNTQVGLKYRF
jgi:hypothetical protein